MAGDESRNDVILLIRRSDNTLKGTIKQLLEIDEIKHIENKAAYERLIKANQTISEQRFKDEIYHKFLVEIKNDKTDGALNRVKRNNLYALLTNEPFEERMLAAGGPIDRIFHKVVTTELDDRTTKFELQYLPRGFGHTL